jgi:hypothetical protein
MRVPKQKRISVNVSLPVDFYCHLEDLWRDRWNQGHTVLRLREFLAELISMGFQVWQERNGAAATLNVPRTREGLKDLFREWDETMGSPPPTGVLQRLHLVESLQAMEEESWNSL